jgi:hypothetical protein
LRISLKERIRGWKGGPKTGWKQGYFTDNSNIDPLTRGPICRNRRNKGWPPGTTLSSPRRERERVGERRERHSRRHRGLCLLWSCVCRHDDFLRKNYGFVLLYGIVHSCNQNPWINCIAILPETRHCKQRTLCSACTTTGTVADHLRGMGVSPSLFSSWVFFFFF